MDSGDRVPDVVDEIADGLDRSLRGDLQGETVLALLALDHGLLDGAGAVGHARLDAGRVTGLDQVVELLARLRRLRVGEQERRQRATLGPDQLDGDEALAVLGEVVARDTLDVDALEDFAANLFDATCWSA